MKLVIIVTHKENTKDLDEVLLKNEYQFTKAETEGGFLRKQNFTYYLGVEKNKVDDVLSLIKKTCKSHEEIASQPPIAEGQPGEVLIPNGSTKVKIGGAIVFVINTDKFVKY